MCKGLSCDTCVCTCDFDLMHPKEGRGPWVRIHSDSCEMHGEDS